MKIVLRSILSNTVCNGKIVAQWFGNMVTMAWWDDLWLNEGFANTLMYFAVDSVYSDWRVVGHHGLCELIMIIILGNLLIGYSFP